jgi:hypothetical protein
LFFGFDHPYSPVIIDGKELRTSNMARQENEWRAGKIRTNFLRKRLLPIIGQVNARLWQFDLRKNVRTQLHETRKLPTLSRTDYFYYTGKLVRINDSTKNSLNAVFLVGYQKGGGIQ